MKSDAEIKEWIDSKDALSKLELGRFLYGYKNANNVTNKWWFYVLQTKKLTKLYQYKIDKINKAGIRNDKEYIQKLLENDIRLKQAGTRNQVAYLKKFYNINISRATLMKWRKEKCED